MENQNDKPDREKLAGFAQQLNDVRPPDVQSTEARQLLSNTLSLLSGLVQALETFGQEEAASAAE